MPAQRKLKPEQEAAAIAWYAQYQRALNELRRVGTVRQKAKELGVAPRTLDTIVKREQDKVRRVLGGVRTKFDEAVPGMPPALKLGKGG